MRWTESACFGKVLERGALRVDSAFAFAGSGVELWRRMRARKVPAFGRFVKPMGAERWPRESATNTPKLVKNGKLTSVKNQNF